MIKTPYYIISEEKLNSNYNKLVSALEQNWNNYIIGYSYKTNSLPWVVMHMDELGCYSEVVSEHEYGLGKLLGMDKGKFIYNGPIKTKESMIEVLEAGGYVNIDSHRELEWLSYIEGGRNYNIGLRVNYDIELDCPGQSSGGNEGSRFGFCYENGELKKAIDYVASLGFTVRGLHIHIGSKTRSIDIYKSIARKLCEIARVYKLNLSFVDIGGGYFGDIENKPQFMDYMVEVSEILRTYFIPEKTILIVEPGASLIASPIRYVMSVIDVKDTNYGRFVVTDGSRTHVDPQMHKKDFFNSIEFGGYREKLPYQTIVGYTCMENDRLLKLIDKPMLQIGDKVIFDRVGSYTMCLAPLFIKFFPSIYVEKGNNLELVRREWSAEDYVNGGYVDGKKV